MLTVVYDFKKNQMPDIPEATHAFVVKGFNHLGRLDQQQLRQYIVKHKLNLSLNESVTHTSDETRHVVTHLQEFMQARENRRPQWYQSLIGWLAIFFMFAFPVYIAYHFSDWLQNQYIAPWIERISQYDLFQQSVVQALMFGDYGVLSLGTYSLVWSLPVVILLSFSTALIEQSHVKQYMIWSISPTMEKMGLDGTDIIPVLEGFGCNAAAIVQAGHQCRACTRSKCMSLISFGSSCSYQIGATLSIFNVSHHSWLFAPYLMLVFIGGVIHNKIWYRDETPFIPYSVAVGQKIQWPDLKNVGSQMWETVKMFIFQAMPIFIGICLIASTLALTPILTMISKIFVPILMLLHIPHDLSVGILFSMIRKDGMLLFNMGGGSVIQSLSAWQVLLLVFFSSTFTACSVTMTMVMRQLGLREGGKMILRQMATSVCCIALLGVITFVVLQWTSIL
ncbi:hypothetical protein HMPREF1208_01736 [Staphylococcus sp. HGB0015]|uniref:nucleoside recognition domain-containing protein n=1 Tax=Staphylococcus TaxID=1279 RepID=UPI00034EB9CA|nr:MULTISPECIES: nucleoside recognition domain-containing protein [Staphylococcus]EPD49278.1 hypothetical protein HMPREF1208_01736 [Staphylococcus sp. HGB0015]